MAVTAPRPGLHDSLPAGPGRLPDRDGLARLLAALPWLDGVDGARAEVRLRWKPGTNLRVGAVVPAAGGPAAVLVAVFAPEATSKGDRIADAAARCGAGVYRRGSLIAVAAHADPALRGLVPAGVPLSYNPARRWVGRVGDRVLKAHAHAPPPGVATLIAGPPPRLAAHLPAATVEHGGRLVGTTWVPGPAPGPADLPAVAEALAALHATPFPAGLPVLDAARAVRAARDAGRAVVAAIPGERPRVLRLLGLLLAHAGRWPPPTSLVHGDFSPDQVVVTADRAVLLDLDRAAVGPAGWDAAQWVVAQLAAGDVALPSPAAPPEPVLVLAAALLRAPEPIRRIRPGWSRLVGGLLDRAEVAAAELTGRAP